MSVDPSASHILESALKSLARALLDENVQGEEWYGSLEPTLPIVCQELGTKAVDVMTNRYGLHCSVAFLLCSMGILPKSSPKGSPDLSPHETLPTKLGLLPISRSMDRLYDRRGMRSRIFSKLSLTTFWIAARKTCGKCKVMFALNQFYR
ncbi:unnamed protein product [Calypogeia fissa]